MLKKNKPNLKILINKAANLKVKETHKLKKKRKRKRKKTKIKRRKLQEQLNKQPTMFLLLSISHLKNLMLPLKLMKDSVSWKVGKLQSNSNSQTINSKAILPIKSKSIKFQESQNNNSRQRKLSNKSIYNIWEKQLKFKDKSEDLPKELLSQEENWLISVKI